MTSLAERWLEAAYSGKRWLMALRPLEALYRCAMRRRAAAYADGRKAIWRAPVPVIVVGNITLGGTGKSPLVAWLARYLVEAGWTPGILSRGYGGRSERYPLYLEADTPVAESGDEPRMLADQTGCPVVVDPDRPRGGRRLLEAGCDILISDDGLQHLALGRDLEIVVVDGQRGLGNERCLPAGPLREPAERLATVDAVMINGRLRRPLPAAGHAMQLTPVAWRVLDDGRREALSPPPFAGPVHALAGIGRPARFFETLGELGVEFEAHAFADHHRFTAADLAFDDERPVVMTAKDAVKCRSLVSGAWSLDVEAVPEPAFVDWLARRLAML
ncbi:tetraacyldisaccharide 4'-kinase [Halomonas elongata]|uniref:tetraacyldisaccharide 4'-kinase n=1 Tax=Halomonas elongata TaxID=2746 RepID=UPI00186B8355|nr:tetraacyldisaccharide 4'-kinase [Halomonas elongata]MBW5798572.1 tetraacyldisaccharide 4'-kinase [Halomonas elongata]